MKHTEKIQEWANDVRTHGNRCVQYWANQLKELQDDKVKKAKKVTKMDE